MTRFDRVEADLPEHLAALAGARVPDYFDDLLQQTARQRQRPAWSSIERWLPMDIAIQPASTRARSVVVLAVLALVGLLIAASLLAFVGSHQSRVPAPFGPAGNGSLYFAGASGDIVALDAATGTSRTILSGIQADGAPLPSRDGRLLAIPRLVPGGDRIDIANQDGSAVRPLVGTYSELSEIDWSPADDRIALISKVAGAPVMTILQADGSGARAVSLPVGMQDFWWLSDGRIIFEGLGKDSAGPTYGIYVVNGDGTGLRPVLPPTSSETDWLGIGPSPDGPSLVYHRWRTPAELGRLHVVDVDTGVDREVQIVGTTPSVNYEGPAFSPDGRMLLFTRYDDIGARLAVVPVTGGTAISIGPTTADAQSAHAMFAPDGKAVLAYYPGTKELWLLDPTGGQDGGDRRLNVTVSDLPNWQRIAP